MVIAVMPPLSQSWRSVDLSVTQSVTTLGTVAIGLDFQGPQGGDEEAPSFKEGGTEAEGGVVDKGQQGGVDAHINKGGESVEGEEEGKGRLDKPVAWREGKCGQWN